jgi:hypothetical protein
MIVQIPPYPPIGIQNGSNKTFALLNTPNPSTTLELWLNGDLLKQGTDYSVSGDTFTYVSYAPVVADTQLVAYSYIL